MLVDFWVPKRSVTYVQRLEIVEIFTQWYVPNMSSYLSLRGQSTSLCHIQHHESLCNVAPIPYPLPAFQHTQLVISLQCRSIFGPGMSVFQYLPHMH